MEVLIDRDWARGKVNRQALVLLEEGHGHGGEMMCW